MVLSIYTKNASNLTNRYLGMVLEGRMDRRIDGRTTPKQYPSDFKAEDQYQAEDKVSCSRIQHSVSEVA